MDKIDKPEDKLFKKTFENIAATRLFLKNFLPSPIRNSIDFEDMVIDNTVGVSTQFKENLADIVIKTTIKTTTEERRNTDIYVLMEHKSYRDPKVLVQLLMYMVTMWQKDLNEKKPLRVIIPLIFYHGKNDWTVPATFAGQFDVDDQIKEFLLDYKYIMFDTREWDMFDDSNREIRENVFLFSALALMKHTYNNDIAGIEALFRYWYEKKFIQEKEQVIMFLMYISEIKDIAPDQLKNLLEKSNIDGGDIMQTLAQRWKNEGRQEGRQEGRLEKKMEVAKNMLLNGIREDVVMKCTGLTKEEIRRLIN